MFGWLNVDKTAGITSRDAVNHIQRLVHSAKLGHAGTLDPLASGVLMIGLGAATRLIGYLQAMPKSYRAVFLLGHRSDTDDVEGAVRVEAAARRPSADELTAVMGKFAGPIMQRPPAFSAVKVQGQRAYALARRGHRVQLAPRLVIVHELSMIAYDYPELVLQVRCGKGTYVRALGRDIAESVGSCAVMSALRRTAIGPFAADEASALEGFRTRDDVLRALLPAAAAVIDLPRVTLTQNEVVEIGHGRAIETRVDYSAAEIAAFDERGTLVAILAPRSRESLGPVKTFLT